MIIKCPECGHQVSDKAPVCPSCGVEIAGHVVKCPHCGEIYLKADEICPNCHQPQTASTEDLRQEEEEYAQTDHQQEQAPVQQEWQREDQPAKAPVVTPVDEEEPIAIATPIVEEVRPTTTHSRHEQQTGNQQQQTDTNHTGEQQKPKEDKEKKNKHISLLVSLAITVITCFVLLYFYQDGKANTERNDFESAMQSKNADVLQQYITDYEQTAPIAHIQEARKLLTSLQGIKDDWADVEKQNTRAGYEAYRKAHPNTPHKQQIEEKLDSMDWAAACAANNEDAYAKYIAQHPDGRHLVEAGKLAQQLMTVTEKKMEADAAKQAEPVRRLLVAMNSKSTEGISGAVAETLTFNGASNATSKEVVKYMRDKLYQADVKSITWKMEKPTACDKIEAEDPKAVSYKMIIPAKLEIVREGGKATLQYSIRATVNAQGRITDINLARQ